MKFSVQEHPLKQPIDAFNDFILEPSANKSVILFLLKLIASAFVTLPTDVALVIHAGLAIPVVLPLFPVAAITLMFFAIAFAIELVNKGSSLSQCEVNNAEVPRLIVITEILNLDALFTHQSIPLIKFEPFPLPLESKTFIAIIFASGATPLMLSFVDATIPAT